MNVVHGAVAVFEERAHAELALTALHEAGFQPGQIALARQLTREEMRISEAANDEPPNSVVAGLTHYFSSLLGFADDADQHAADFNEGRTIIRVKADGRCEEAMAILQRHGGYNRKTVKAASLEAGRAKPA